MDVRLFGLGVFLDLDVCNSMESRGKLQKSGITQYFQVNISQRMKTLHLLPTSRYRWRTQQASPREDHRESGEPRVSDASAEQRKSSQRVGRLSIHPVNRSSVERPSPRTSCAKPSKAQRKVSRLSFNFQGASSHPVLQKFLSQCIKTIGVDSM